MLSQFKTSEHIYDEGAIDESDYQSRGRYTCVLYTIIYALSELLIVFERLEIVKVLNEFLEKFHPVALIIYVKSLFGLM